MRVLFKPKFARQTQQLKQSLALLLVLLSLSTACVMAGPPDVNWSSLDLNAQQSSSINQIEAEWRKVYQETNPALNRDKEELMKLLNSPSADQGQIKALQNRVNSAKSRLQDAAMNAFLEKKRQLNGDQLKRLQQQMGQ